MKNAITMPKIIMRAEMNFYGTVLPKGVIYGEDADGPYYCREYKMFGLSKSGRPIMQLNRLNKRTGLFEGSTEARATCDEILDLFFAREKDCIIPDSWVARGWNPARPAKKLDNANIAKEINTPFTGCDEHKKLPKGAVYGHDGNDGTTAAKLWGYFYCVDFDNIKFDKWGYPILWVWRPVYTDANYRMTWKKGVEHGPVTQAIFKLWLKDGIAVDYGDTIKELAERQFRTRPGWNDGVQWKGTRVMPNQMNRKKGTRLAYTCNKNRTLEDVAVNQPKGELMHDDGYAY